MFQPSYDTGGAAAPQHPLSSVPDPEPLPAARRSLLRWIGPAFTAAMIVAVLANIRRLHLADIQTMVPRTPVFWGIFILCYLALPLGDWLIYRRLWRIPAGGLLPLLRKMVSNEILFGYSGEVYFYAWSRRNSAMVAAPFGAIKDVAILSALVGNIFTLCLAALAYPFVGRLALGGYGHDLYAGAAVLLVCSLAVLPLQRRVFSLPVADRNFIAFVHAGRLLATTLLTALMWHLVLPGVGMRWWVVLAALHLLVGRLPLVTNKDLVFAGIAFVLVGRQTALADLLAMMAVLVLGAHLGVALLLAAVPDGIARGGAR
ncbi:MAG: hypothetical protein QOH81_3374 [Sphingomonadales bacterium]|nr:hypothetical protein [Sphingomonadales bacterium]